MAQQASGARRFGMGVPAIASALLLAACSRGGASLPPVAVEIDLRVGDQPLALQQDFLTPAGEHFTARQFRYYLSGFRLHRSDGAWFALPTDPDSDAGYFLIDAAVSASQTLALPGVPAGDYDAIEFRLGIDAARNHAGAQRGTLDPAQGMFWMWNTGYVFLKLEGESPASPDSSHRVTIHLGDDSLARSIALPLGGQGIHVRAGVQPTIHLAADLAELLGGTPPLHFADTHSVMDVPAGVPLADRAARMFRVEHVHNEPAPGKG